MPRLNHHAPRHADALCNASKLLFVALASAASCVLAQFAWATSTAAHFISDSSGGAIHGGVLVDPPTDNWKDLSQAWAASAGAARCNVNVVVQDGDLSAEKEATPSVIAWDAADHKFALTQGALTVLVDSTRMMGLRAGVDVAVDRALTIEPALALRKEIPESPWPQLGVALRNQSEQWWIAIDPELGELALKSFVQKDDGPIIVLLVGKNGSLELTFNAQTATLRAATRRIESGPRVPPNAAIEWRMTFDAVPIPAEMLTLDVGDRRRVERLDDLPEPTPIKVDTELKDSTKPNAQLNPEIKSVPEIKP